MSEKKTLCTKKRLMHIAKQSRKVPDWVVIRTSRRFMRHPKQRNWRRSKI